MSEANETDTLLVYVRREVREVVAFTVPLGWKPESHWDLVQILNDGKELPKHQWATWEPDALKKWPDWWRIVEPGESVPSPSDAREIIATMSRGYDPEELRELQEQGAKAWADVPDAAQWVRDLRGGNL